MPQPQEACSHKAQAAVATIAGPLKEQAKGAACRKGQLARDTNERAKNAGKAPPVVKGAAVEDKDDAPKKKATNATVRPRQQHRTRRPAGHSFGRSSGLVVARPLSSGFTRRRSGDQGFSAFFDHCKRVLVAASYRGNTKNPLDALGVVFLPFLAASFPLGRYFQRRQTLSHGEANTRTKGPRKPRPIENEESMSDAVKVSVDEVTHDARFTVVKIGAGNQAAHDVQEPRGPVVKACKVANNIPTPRQEVKLAEQPVTAAPMPQGDDTPQLFAGLTGTTSVPAGRTCLPAQQHCPRFGRIFLAIRHSAFVYQTEEWKPRGRTLYLPLTYDVMINALRVDQLSFESGQFFLADDNGHYTGAKSGHAIHFWRYDRVAKELYVSQSIVFLNELDYLGVLQQLELI